jgi:uncharacterized protein DUF3347
MCEVRNGFEYKTIKKVKLMKQMVILTVAASVTFAACNGDQASKGNDAVKLGTDTTRITQADTTSLGEVPPTFSNVEPTLAASLKAVVDHYLDVKNALVNNNGDEAARGGKAMAEAIEKVDKSLLTVEQKKVYDDIEDDLKEHAEHIAKNSGDIKHQREHFVMMSEDVYDLAKAFGGGQKLYHDHCPMANDNKGAMWLSETREVKNPYFGGKMNECVKVQEVIK